MATLKYFRCHNPACAKRDQGKFSSEQPVCPQCGISAADEKLGRVIQRMALVHFDPPTGIPAIGENLRACDRAKIIQVQEMPNGIPNPWHAGTGCVVSVTCPACKETPEYKAALAALEDEDGPSTLPAAMNRIESQHLRQPAMVS